MPNLHGSSSAGQWCPGAAGTGSAPTALQLCNRLLGRLARVAGAPTAVASASHLTQCASRRHNFHRSNPSGGRRHRRLPESTGAKQPSAGSPVQKTTSWITW
uniref:Secreted protein n=1 Tax=Macrostomum lignano TaxID=282301 RepID=A0A1I8ID66_9PLAT